MKQLRVGIVGVGNIGTAHANAIYAGKEPLMTLAFLCDISQSRLDGLRTEFPGITLFSSYEEAIDKGECDAVIVATPHYFHPVISEYAIKRKIHVLCEKPLGVYTKGLMPLCTLARENNVEFAIMLNQRANKLFNKARALINDGIIGKIRRGVWIITNWYRTQEYYSSATWRGSWRGEGGGVLINQAPHNLDIFQWLLGMPDKINAKVYEGHSHKIEVEDEAYIHFEYENGANGIFIASTGDKYGENRLEIVGENGKIVLEKGVLTCEYEGSDGKIQTVTENDEEYEGHLAIISNFARAILMGEKLISPAIDGINQLTLTNGAYLSSWKGETVRLPLDEDEYLKYLSERVDKSATGTGKEDNPFYGSYAKKWGTNW